MTLVGHVVETKTFSFADGVFSFHTAFNGSGTEITTTTFRSRMTVWPSLTAARSGITYKLLLGATDDEIEQWLDENKDHQVLKRTVI